MVNSSIEYCPNRHVLSMPPRTIPQERSWVVILHLADGPLGMAAKRNIKPDSNNEGKKKKEG